MRNTILARSVRIALLGGLFLVMSTGCAMKMGKEFDAVVFESKVKHGETTQNDVLDLMGPPVSKGFSVETDGTKLTRWLYYYGNGNMLKMSQATFKMLEVKFDEKHKLVSYNWTTD